MNWKPPDSFHLQAAVGWLELGNWQEANEELKQIAAHPLNASDALNVLNHAGLYESLRGQPAA